MQDKQVIEVTRPLTTRASIQTGSLSIHLQYNAIQGNSVPSQNKSDAMEQMFVKSAHGTNCKEVTSIPCT